MIIPRELTQELAIQLKQEIYQRVCVLWGENQNYKWASKDPDLLLAVIQACAEDEIFDEHQFESEQIEIAIGEILNEEIDSSSDSNESVEQLDDSLSEGVTGYSSADEAYRVNSRRSDNNQRTSSRRNQVGNDLPELKTQITLSPKVRRPSNVIQVIENVEPNSSRSDLQDQAQIDLVDQLNDENRLKSQPKVIEEVLIKTCTDNDLLKSCEGETQNSTNYASFSTQNNDTENTER